MTEQDFKDAYILLIFGAARIVPGKGIEWKDEFGNICYIFFPDITDSSKAVVRGYWENRNKRCEEGWKDGQLHGKSLSWYENGNKWREEEYKNGKRHGKCLGWYVDGIKRCEEEWKNDKLIRKIYVHDRTRF